MGLGGLSALSGLAKPIDRVGAEAREFDAMNQYKADVEKDAQASLAAQELEAKQYAEISEKASQLLEPDRDKIRSKSIELQKMIRSKIEEYGSRKAFFTAGGAALLAKYKNDLLSSKETTSFFDNKKNMESLIKLKEAGKGHLISSIDLQSMNNYLEGRGGNITYSGMKSEVEIPENYFDYGIDIPAQNILHYKDNYMGIYGNWLIENPDKADLKGPDLEEQLLSYTMRNHSGKGLNEFNRKAEAAARSVRQEKEAIAKGGTDEETPMSWTASMNEQFSQIRESRPRSVSDLMKPGNYLLQEAKTNPSFSALIGRATPYEVPVSNYTSQDDVAGFQWGLGKLDKAVKGLSRSVGLDNKYKLASSIVVPGNLKSIKSAIYTLDEAGKVNADLNSSNFYSPNGEKLTEELVKDALDSGENSNLTFQQLVYANFDGDGKLITQKLDSNGKNYTVRGSSKLHENDADHSKQYRGDVTTDMVAVLKTADGKTIYQRIDSSSVRDETELALAIGKADDITTATKRRMKVVQDKGELQKQKDFVNKNLSLIVKEASAPGKPFGTPEFINQAREGRSPSGSNRDALIKAYYMAMAHFKNGRGALPEDLEKEPSFSASSADNFINIVNSSSDLKNALINHSKVSDKALTDLFVKVHSGNDPDDLEHNKQFQQYWLEYYTNLKKK